MNKNKYIEVEPGVKLHLTDKGFGRPVVLIHGWPLSDEIFKYQYEDLKENGYRAIGITLRGFGKSDKPEGKYDFATFAKDLHTVIHALALENVILTGFSFGGVVATEYITTYTDHRIGKLVLLSSNIPLTTQLEDHPYGFTKAQFDAIITGVRENRQAVLSPYGPIFSLDESFLPLAEGNWISSITNEAGEEAIIKAMIALIDMDMRPVLHQINIPTAIFHATNDFIIPFEIALEAHLGIKDAVLVRFEHGGHWLFLKEREKFIVELLNFIVS